MRISIVEKNLLLLIKEEIESKSIFQVGGLSDNREISMKWEDITCMYGERT